MPELGLEFHDWWLEGIFGWNVDVDGKCAALIGRVWRARESGFEVSYVVGAGHINSDVRAAVFFYVLELFCNTTHAVAVARHVDC